VRNALLGEAVKDIDIATTALPDEVMRLAGTAGLKPVPTGIEHGTVTVIANHTPFEVTTLRRDIETFGRHARVTFTRDWVEDARRRDFTINALYCAQDGTVHDPIGGYGDLAARRVRFIGEAEERIREDYLRILRFFRFAAEYVDGAPDAAGLAAAIALRDGLDQLSGERVRAEFLRLLSARRAPATLAVMDEAGILAHVLPVPANTGAVARLAAIERAVERPADPLLRLGALALDKPGDALTLRDRLRLSTTEYERLARMAMPDPAFAPAGGERDGKVFIYRHGNEAFADGLLLAWARGMAPPDDTALRDRLAVMGRWLAPALPVRGSDVVALGVPAGPEIGRVMAAFEDWWIARDFPSDPAALAAALQSFAKVTKS
jgi:poly(A) polymerase